MSIVLWRVMVLIVEGGITGRPVHHARRLSVHHVTHRRVRTVRPARACGQWRKHYTLLRLDHCPVIGEGILEKLVGSLETVIRLPFSSCGKSNDVFVNIKMRSNELCIVFSQCHVFMLLFLFFFLILGISS